MAGCIQLNDVTSMYSWKGEMCSDAETRLTIKTDLSRFSELEKRIVELHSYDTPQVIGHEIAVGSSDYLAWLEGACSRIA